jgi:S-adenosylmethionine:tRNA ribosyltransferase-isomerase
MRETALGGEGFEFTIPPHLEASEPPEARGLARDEVRLMVSFASTDRVGHYRFRDLPALLNPGDVLVINTSGTLNASIPARRAAGTPLELHLSTQLPGGLWTVEARSIAADGTQPLFDLEPGEKLTLPAGGLATIHTQYDCGCGRHSARSPKRLWVATLHLPAGLHAYLAEHGSPIRYRYVKRSWPSSYYQTVYATEPGSAEMPSAGRAFTPDLITRLVARGIQIAPLILHTGVASLESSEPPYEELYRVPSSTVRTINAARLDGNRIIAVGTTVVRALQTVADTSLAPSSPRAGVHPGEGWTCVVVTPDTDVRVVDGLITGLHEPRSSHLMMLEAIAGRHHLERAYAAALDEDYLWHEFGDEHLILP